MIVHTGSYLISESEHLSKERMGQVNPVRTPFQYAVSSLHFRKFFMPVKRFT